MQSPTIQLTAAWLVLLCVVANVSRAVVAVARKATIRASLGCVVASCCVEGVAASRMPCQAARVLEPVEPPPRLTTVLRRTYLRSRSCKVEPIHSALSLGGVVAPCCAEGHQSASWMPCQAPWFASEKRCGFAGLHWAC